MSEVPIETRIALQRLVRRKCMEVLGVLGGQYALGVEFATRYYVAIKSGDKAFKRDVRDVYRSFGLNPQLLEAIAEEMDKRYGQQE